MTSIGERHSVTARQAGDCVKALYLARTGAEQSEPPDQQAENRMEAGQAMKDVVSRAMQRQNWELRSSGRMVEIEIADNLCVRATADEVARHPDITGGEWIVVQTGSAKNTSFNRWLKETSFGAYPQRVHQMALVTSGYRDDPEPPEDLNLDQPQMIVMLNRDTGVLEYEPLDVEDLEAVTEDLRDNLHELSEALANAEEPDAPFKRTTRRCQQCPFLTRCHGRQTRGPKSDTVTTEQLDAALTIIEELYEEVEAAKPMASKFDRARRVIRTHMVESDVTDLRLQGESRVWIAHLEKEARVNLNAEKARERVSAAIMAEISTTSDVMSFGPEM